MFLGKQHIQRTLTQLISFLSIFVLFLAPAIASAQVYATPTKTHHFCFTDTINTTTYGTYDTSCYATMAACQGAAGSFTCTDSSAEIIGMEKVVRDVKAIPSKIVDGVLDMVGSAIMTALAFLSELISELAAIVLSSMAVVLDMSISRTINASTYKDLVAVQVGWTAIRDISNMFFIFILLYISINTILGIQSSQTKRLVANVIISALLINFSLFFTQVVIDAGNVLAHGFWDKMKTQQGYDASGNPVVVSSISTTFMEGFKIQTVKSNQNTVQTNGKTIELTAGNRFAINMGGTILMLIASYIFLAGAIMMVIRTVTLLILMIISPFAFLMFAYPGKHSSPFHTWFDRLIQATFVAPAFIIMLYINSIIIKSMDAARLTGSMDTSIAAAMTGSADNFAIIYNFIVMAALLISSLYVANEVSTHVAGKVGNHARTALGYGGGLSVAAVGIAGGRFGRQVGGSTGRALQNSKKVDEWAKSKNWMVRNIATTAKRTGTTMAKGTWDVRNTGAAGHINTALSATGTGVSLKGVGSGSKKSFETHGGLIGSAITGQVKPSLNEGGIAPRYYKGTENEKKVIDEAKSLYAYNPEARQQFIKDRGVDLTEIRNKGAGNELNRDLTKKKAKDTLEAAKEKEKQIAEGKITREEAKIEGEEIGKAVKDAMAKLTTAERVELAAANKDNVHFLNNLNKSDFSSLHRNEMEGKTNGLLKDVTDGVMKTNNFALQNYIMNPENQNRLTMVDHEAIKSNSELMANFTKRKEAEDQAKKNTPEAKREESQYIRDKMKGIREENRK